MELLRPGDDIKLTIQHDPLPAGFQVSSRAVYYNFIYSLIVNHHKTEDVVLIFSNCGSAYMATQFKNACHFVPNPYRNLSLKF